MASSNDEIRLKPTALAGLVIALLGSNWAVTQISTRPEYVRPDPFTGSEGRALQAQINQAEKRMDGLEKRIDALRSDVNLVLGDIHEHRVIRDDRTSQAADQAPQDDQQGG